MGALSGISAFWIVAGALAVALPVAAHLLARRRPPTVEFPAARLVREALAAHARRRRLRDLALLATRVGAVALVAMAFDRPTALVAAEDPAAAGGRDVVLVLDASASMTRIAGGRTLFDRARDRAMVVVRSVDAERDRVAVIVSGRAARPLLPALSRNVSALAAELAAAEATLERCDLGSALELALAIGGADGDPLDGAARPRTIMVISDLQRSGWEGAGEIAAGVGVVIEDVGAEAPTENVSIESATVRGRAAVIRLKNHGAAEASATVRAGVTAIGAEPSAPGVAFVQIGPGEERLVEVELATAPSDGPAALRAWIDDGVFAPDDDSWSIVSAGGDGVTVVTSGRVGERSGARFVSTAVEAIGGRAPLVATGGDGAPPVAGMAAIVVDVGVSGRAWSRRLADASRRGVGVVWVVDSQASLEGLRAFAADAGAARLAGWLASARFVEGEPARLASPAPGGAVLSGLGPAMSMLDGVRVARRVVGAAAAGASAPLAFEDGGAMVMIDRAALGGAVVVLGADLGLDGSMLARSPLFPALVGDVLALAGGEREGEAFEVGEPVAAPAVRPVDESELVRDGAGRPALVTGGAGASVVSMRALASPGLALARDEAGELVAAAAVALAREERSFERIAPDEARALLAAREADGPAAATGLASVARPEPTQLWPAIAIAVAALLAFESVVAAGRRRPVKGAAP